VTSPVATRVREALPRVLVVEDDPDQRDLIRRRLETEGYDVRVVGSGRAALAALDEVELVLLDQRLPDISGIEVLDAMRGRNPEGPAGGGPSVVMVTGTETGDLIIEAMRAGAVDYVIKDPSYLRSLPAVVERAWRHHEMARRAHSLQHLALLVTSATDRGRIFSEIVHGAQELLGAEACALVLREADLELVATAGDAGDAIGAARALGGDQRTLQLPGTLVVRLPGGADRTLGVLVVRTPRDDAVSGEDLRLAETFASYAGVALDRLRRAELERSLVVELQRAVDQRQEFLAAISHELRTPLACILGFAETLREHRGALSDDDGDDLLARMVRHATDLRRLVDQLLEVATRERGLAPIAAEELDLLATVRASVDDLRPLLADREVRLEIAPTTVLADRSLLGRVLTNLLSNAAKYSPERTPITVRGGPVDDRLAHVEVVDRGVGMTHEEVARVFEAFWRGTEATRQAARGTGIGLALVRDYVRRMGGDVSVDSEPGVGSTFGFTLLRPSSG
jgi:two-component system, OmpR family, sensor histidine kinase KdpD